MTQKLITIEEAAQLKGVSTSAVYAAAKEGRLPHERVLGRIGLRESDVQQWTPRSYAGRPGAKGGRPRGLPMSEAAKQRISEAQKQRWSRRESTT